MGSSRANIDTTERHPRRGLHHHRRQPIRRRTITQLTARIQTPRIGVAIRTNRQSMTIAHTDSGEGDTSGRVHEHGGRAGGRCTVPELTVIIGTPGIKLSVCAHSHRVGYFRKARTDTRKGSSCRIRRSRNRHRCATHGRATIRHRSSRCPHRRT